MIWRQEQLAEALGVRVDRRLQAGIVQFNSKEIKPGEIFIALAGKTDGHLYAESAIKQGAACVIVARAIKNVAPEKTIIVKDTKVALKLMAAYKRQRSKAKFIGITGSVGKTSTKDALAIMLSNFGKTFASRGNFNNDLGVAINLASLADDTEYAVFEMGMNRPGEISQLSKIVKPDIAMIGLVTATHLEFFSSMALVADAKSEIVAGLSPQGFVVVNASSVFYRRIIANIKKIGIKNIATYGALNSSCARLDLYRQLDTGIYLLYNVNSQQIATHLPYLLPKHQAENFAGCMAVIAHLSLDLAVAVKSLTKFVIGEGRGKMLNAIRGEHSYKIISDYYNASPASVRASLEHFSQIDHVRKVVIIGDMLELGERSPALHRQLTPFIIASRAIKILLVGTLVKFIYDALPKNLFVRQFATVDELLADLPEILQGEELILIKGSRGTTLEKTLRFFEQIVELKSDVI